MSEYTIPGVFGIRSSLYHTFVHHDLVPRMLHGVSRSRLSGVEPVASHEGNIPTPPQNVWNM